MTRPMVLVPSILLGEAESILEAGGTEVVYALGKDDGARAMGGDAIERERWERLLEEKLAALLPEADVLSAVGVGGQLAVTAELLDAGKKLRVVFVPSAGTDAIDVPAATQRGIAVINAPGNNYISVAEHAVGLMLALIRKIALLDRLSHRDGRLWTAPEAGGWPGVAFRKTVGVIGFGYVGREFARICRDAFSMRVLVFDPFADAVEVERLGGECGDDLEGMLAACDVVSLHCPLTPATRGLIGAPQLQAMKQSAILLNTARGATVDTAALAAALRDGSIGGAGLDVSEPEPLPDGHELLTMENVVVSPHVAGAAPEVFLRAGAMAARGTLQALAGTKPRNLVDPAVWPAFMERSAMPAEGV